jgi:hypothetical protein
LRTKTRFFFDYETSENGKKNDVRVRKHPVQPKPAVVGKKTYVPLVFNCTIFFRMLASELGISKATTMASGASAHEGAQCHHDKPCSISDECEARDSQEEEEDEEDVGQEGDGAVATAPAHPGLSTTPTTKGESSEPSPSPASSQGAGGLAKASTLLSALQLPETLVKPPEILTSDGGMVKFVIKDGVDSLPSWERGTNAQFHFRVYTIALPWSRPEPAKPAVPKKKRAPKADASAKKDPNATAQKKKKPSTADVFAKITEMMRMKNGGGGDGCGHSHGGHGHGHSHSHSGSHGPSCKPTEDAAEKDKPAVPSEPTRSLVADSRFTDPSKPFELRIGRSFSVTAFEIAVRTMKVGEVARFFCAPNYVDVCIVASSCCVDSPVLMPDFYFNLFSFPLSPCVRVNFAGIPATGSDTTSRTSTQA